MQDGYFGLFAGFIEEGATIAGVSVDGMIRIGEINWDNEKAVLNVLANGQLTGLTGGASKLQVYGSKNWAEENSYYYTINPQAVTKDDGGDISLIYEYGQKFAQESYDIIFE